LFVRRKFEITHSLANSGGTTSFGTPGGMKTGGALAGCWAAKFICWGGGGFDLNTKISPPKPPSKITAPITMPTMTIGNAPEFDCLRGGGK
jgi:hypothetical protein